ncbi:unnamed protein product [Cochlearia groenlandica]
MKNREEDRSSQKSKRKLEDYLDPFLLHTISSKINRTESKEKPIAKKKDVFVETNRRRFEFDWPVDRLQPLINDQNLSYGEKNTTEYGCFVVADRRRSDFPIWNVDDNKYGA